jgi:hypothetical protein
MSNIQQIMATGNSAASATAIVGSTLDSLTATGSTQNTALALSAINSVVTTTAASTGVRLPLRVDVGGLYFVANLGANALTIYPGTGESINALSANTGLSLAAGSKAVLIKTSATRWVSKTGT